MKKTRMFNNKKIIIFILLIIGIILLSPIINKSVYAKTGKLPAQINKGLVGTISDAISKALNDAEAKYTKHPLYTQNARYINSSVSAPVTEGDSFWTATGSKLQNFDKNYQTANSIATDRGTSIINGTSTSSTLGPFTFQDLEKYKDVYCAHKGTRLLQAADDIETIFDLPAGSELVKRLEYFISQRNNILRNLNTRNAVFNKDASIATRYTYLDDYGISYNKPDGTTRDKMLTKFGYNYSSSSNNPTFPYVIEEISKGNPVADRYVIPVVGTDQRVISLWNIWEDRDTLMWATSEVLRQFFDRSVDSAIQIELGNIYDPEGVIKTGYHRLPDSVADSKNMPRTRSFYELVNSGKKLSAQSAFALALESHNKNENSYPGAAQEVLWTMLVDQIIDPRGTSEYVQYVVKNNNSARTKTLAEAFGAYYERLVEWKSRNNNTYTPKFLETERNIIFNSKSTTYSSGAWLVGPYKVDYLLSNIKYNNDELYFAGMTDMKVYGEYNTKTNKIKEIQKWSYFVPLQTGHSQLTEADIAKGKVTSLKHGVPEPNQEFYIEIPYDENLISISQLQASFQALDYDAQANYYLGAGEYVDFGIDVALEKFDQISNRYEHVMIETGYPKFSIPDSSSDIGLLTVRFKRKVFIDSMGNTDPYIGPNERGVWEKVDDYTIQRKVSYIAAENNLNLNNQGFYYTYDAVMAEGTNIKGGMVGFNSISFSKPYLDEIRLNSSQFNLFPKGYITSQRIYTSANGTVSYRVVTNLKTRFDGGSYKLINYIPMTSTPKPYVLVTEGGQSIPVNVPAKEATPITVTLIEDFHEFFNVRTNVPTRINDVGSYRTEHLGIMKEASPYPITFYSSERAQKTIIVPIRGETPYFGFIDEKENRNVVAQNTLDIEQGDTNKSGVPAFIGLDTGTGSYGPSSPEDYTHVMFKHPDVLIVPRAKLLKTDTQPQMSVGGRLLYITATATLTENQSLDRPGFLLPIGGKVWEDKPYGEKLSTYNFILNKDSQDKNDKMLEGINVKVNRLIIRNSDKAIIEKQEARVFAKGEYTNPIGRNAIKTNNKGEWGKYYLRDLGFTRAEITRGYTTGTHVVKFEVEFEYDGISYEPVPPLVSVGYDAYNFDLASSTKVAGNSVAVENVTVREEFNKSVGEINGSTPINSNRQTVGKAIGVSGVTGSDTSITYSGKYNAQTNRTVSTLETSINIKASTLNTGLLYPIGDVYSIDMKQAMSTNSATSPENGSFDLVVVMNREKAQEFRNKDGITVTDAFRDKSVVAFHEANTHMENINLGLMKRKQVDLELENDLMLSIQFVNKKALVNTFANKYDLSRDPNNEYDYLISKYSENYDDIQYQLDVYKADYIYRTAMYKDPVLQEALETEANRLAQVNKDSAGRELDIYLQYKQALTNYSQVDNAVITGIDMYFDTSLTPVLEPITKEIDKDEVLNNKATGKAAIAGDNVVIGAPEYRIVTLDTMFTRSFENVKPEPLYKDISLHGPYKWTAINTGDAKKLTSLNNTYDANDILLPSARRLEIITNFRVNKDAIFSEDGVTTQNAIRLGNKHHLTEIAGYATYNKYTGKVSGKVDFDSAPANVNLDLVKFNIAGFSGNQKQDLSYLEDDTSTAPMIAIELEKETPREVSGMVWEEKRNTQVARVNMGDGVFSSRDGEKPIANKVVALEERVSIKAIDLSTEYKMSQGFNNKVLKDNTYYVDVPYIWENKIQGSGINIDNLKKLIGFQSYVRTGTDGKYKFVGVPAGNFVVQLPYITVGNSITDTLGILNNNTVETTTIVEVETRDKSPQVYNGQDFKVSIYDGGDKKTINETWLPSAPKANHSYGRDSEYDRYKLYQNSNVINARIGEALEILNVDHSKLDATTKGIIEETANMTAETPLINFGISYYGSEDRDQILYNKFARVFALPGITKSVDGAGNVSSNPATHKYINVNIALEERPKTKLVLDKQVSRLTIKNSDGTKIIDAKYNTTYDIDNIIMPEEDRKVLNAETADKRYDEKRTTNNGYSTQEYILKVKTEVDPDSINGEKGQPINTSIYATKKPYWEDKKSDSNMYTNARGWENISASDTVSRTSNGFINFESLLSDANIEIEYQVQLYNLGEVDRATIQEGFRSQSIEEAAQDEKISKYVGKLAQGTETYSKLNHEQEKDKYGFGRFFGVGYYTGNYTVDSQVGNYALYKEAVAKTYANKIIDYVDNSAVKDDLQNDDWTQIKSPTELNDLIMNYDSTGKKTFTVQADNMVDPDGKSYFTTGGSNIYINDKMSVGLIPYYEYVTARSRGVATANIDPYEANSTIAIRRLSSQQADEDLSFDNIAEIVEYKTDAGRRSPSSTPGNTNTRLSETFSAQNLEPDTGLALLITITPPKGLSKSQRAVFSTLNITLVSMASLAVVTAITKFSLDYKKKRKTIANETINTNNSEQ